MKYYPKALYAGSFDPITKGHLDVIEKARQIFDLHIGIGVNPAKGQRLFPFEQSMEFIRDSIQEQHPGECFDDLGVTIGHYTCSTTRYAREIGVTHIVRGMREISDFGAEWKFRGLIEKFAPELQLVYFICDRQWMDVASSAVRDAVRVGEDVSWMVGKTVNAALMEKFSEGR